MALATTTDGSSGHLVKLLPMAAVAVGALCVWKIAKTCSVDVHPKCITVVYDTRRRSVLCTSADKEAPCESLPRIGHFRPLLYLGSGLLSGRSLVIVPPSSFFAAFTLPRSVFTDPGETVDCVMENVPVSDGAVNVVLTVRYKIPFGQIERYLAAVGPSPPNEVIAVAAAHVMRVRGPELSVGILLNKSRRDAVFLETYKAHLAAKLISEAAVDVSEVIVENIELLND